MPTNEELIEKAIETSNLSTGGRLNPVQQDEFVRLVKDNSTLLKQVRFKQMPIGRIQIDKMYIGEPVSRGVGEKSSTAVDAKAVFDQVPLTATKLKSDWAISTEALQENIEGGNFEDVIMDMMTKRIATDMELLAVQGDTTITPADALTNLTSTLDGWDKLSDSSQIVDAGGATITKELFATAIRRMPEQYLQDPNLKWFVSRAIATDWAEEVSGRETQAGDMALGGNTLRPYGFPMEVVPNIPNRKTLTIAGAAGPQVRSTEFGPYEIVAGSNDAITLRVNTVGAGNVAVTVAAGVYTAVELGRAIIDALIALGGDGILNANILRISDDGQGRLLFTTIGNAAADIIVIAAVANDMYTEIGITAATYNGAASDAVVNEGSFIWLLNPKNLIYGMVDDTRVFTEFNKDLDCIETVVYNQVAVAIENTEAIVKIQNIRRGT
jgi:hypothetical protein